MTDLKYFSIAILFFSHILAAHNIEEVHNFIKNLNSKQKSQALHEFTHSDRKIWHFIPKERTGLRWDDLESNQQKAFKSALKAFLSDHGLNKSFEIMQLEDLVRIMEGRPVGDTYRDPLKYFINFYGKPGDDQWSFRYEGHHLSLTFSGIKNQIISGTPFFFGTNPAIAKSGPQKGHEVLKEEQHLARAFVNSLSAMQQDQAIVKNKAPKELLTKAESIAPPVNDKGLSFKDMNQQQQTKFIELINIYMNRYSQNIQDTIVKKWKQNNWNNYKFAWAGGLNLGDPHYYRIKGPELLLEYCNTQGGANHIHTSIRDYKNDYGEDAFRKHLKEHH
jgi:hypothetical protein